MRRSWSIAISLALVSAAGPVLQAQPAGAAGTEPLQALGSLTEVLTGSTPQAVNAEGFVVGYADPPAASGRAAFIYDPHSRAMTPLPNLSHSALIEVALAINDHRDVVGASVVAQNEDAPGVAVEWRADGQNLVLGTLQNRPCIDPSQGPCDGSTAYDINNHGVVVGETTVADATARHAFVWDPHTAAMRDLGTLPGGANSAAYGINDAGVIVGSSEVGGDPVATHAFRYDLISGSMTDLGTLPGGTTSEARAINAHGLIAGSSDESGGATHPFLFDPTTHSMVDLGALPGQSSNRASALNDRGVVVGSSGAGTGGQAWVYDPRTEVIDPVPGAASAVGINNQGVVVGEGLVPEIIDGQVVGHPFAAYRTTVKLQAPAAPSKVRVTGGCDVAPTLTWTPRRSGPYVSPTWYVVFRNGTPVALTAATTFTDEHATPFARYRVVAGNALGVSPPSSRVRWPCPTAP